MVPASPLIINHYCAHSLRFANYSGFAVISCTFMQPGKMIQWSQIPSCRRSHLAMVQDKDEEELYFMTWNNIWSYWFRCQDIYYYGTSLIWPLQHDSVLKQLIYFIVFFAKMHSRNLHRCELVFEVISQNQQTPKQMVLEPFTSHS